MNSTTSGYTLVEILIVVAMVTVLISITIAYSMNTAAHRLAELDFQEHYLKAKNILLHAQNLHAQGFRTTADLNMKQLKNAARGNDWELIANKIFEITDSHAKDDFKIRINSADIQVRFLVADDVALNGYPVQKHQMAGDQDEVVLTKAMHYERNRILKFNDYLAN